MPQGMSLSNTDPLSIGALLISLAIGACLSIVLGWHFKRFGSTLSNRDEFAQVFPFVLLTTILIISVVKSSLALSLGLVGALSIVRFRTPIKEPEELGYLFIAIAIGLGLGANQILPTIVASVSILGVTAVLKWRQWGAENRNLYLSIDWHSEGESNPDYSLERLNNVITKHVRSSDLRRFDLRQESLEATYLLEIDGANHLNSLAHELRDTFPSVGVTFIDQNRMPSV